MHYLKILKSKMELTEIKLVNKKSHVTNAYPLKSPHG